MWFRVEDKLPDELFTYGRESADVLVAAKCPYSDYWQYGIAYAVRASDGVHWESSNGRKIDPQYWQYLTQPSILPESAAFRVEGGI